MAIYRIVEWDERYEVTDKGDEWTPGKTKRRGPLTFIRLKVHGKSLGPGWRRLLQRAGRKRAPEVFGIFGKLLEISGASEREKRGFIDDQADGGLAFLLDLSESQVKFALSVLCDVGWIQLQDDRSGNFRKIPGNSCSTQLNSTQLNTTKERGGRFTPPTPAEVSEYAKSIGYGTLDAQQFVDHYTAKGWHVGKSPMKDWRAAVRTWKARDATPQGPHESAADLLARLEQKGFV